VGRTVNRQLSIASRAAIPISMAQASSTAMRKSSMESTSKSARAARSAATARITGIITVLAGVCSSIVSAGCPGVGLACAGLSIIEPWLSTGLITQGYSSAATPVGAGHHRLFRRSATACRGRTARPDLHRISRGQQDPNSAETDSCRAAARPAPGNIDDRKANPCTRIISCLVPPDALDSEALLPGGDLGEFSEGCTSSQVWTSPAAGRDVSRWTAVVGRLERTMSDGGLPLSHQARVCAKVVAWGSTDALEAVKRICQAVAVRCDQALATQHHPADAPDNQVSVAS
jgi:hypothetical protein